MEGSSLGFGAGGGPAGSWRPSGGGRTLVEADGLPELPLGPLEEGLRAGGWRRTLALLGHPTVPFFSAFKGPER